MAASNEWTEWHLTSSGWIRGSEKEDFSGVVRKPKPGDCVMTIVHAERISSSFSGLEKTTDQLWVSEDTQAVEALLAKYGGAPTHL